jgi:hypothetical protein
METLNAEDFEAHIGRVFKPHGARPNLTLAQVLHGAPQQVGQRAPFTLILHGPADEVLPEGMHEFTVEQGGVFAFHVMPVHTVTPARQEYQAVFN